MSVLPESWDEYGFDPNKYTKDILHASCQEFGIELPSKSTKPVLVDLLEARAFVLRSQRGTNPTEHLSDTFDPYDSTIAKLRQVLNMYNVRFGAKVNKDIYVKKFVEMKNSGQIPTQTMPKLAAKAPALSTSVSERNVASPRAMPTTPETVPSQTVPSQTVPSQTLPVQTVPSQTLPVQTVPSQTLPAQALPAQALPAQALPAQVLHAQTVIQPTGLQSTGLPRSSTQQTILPQPAPQQSVLQSGSQQTNLTQSPPQQTSLQSVSQDTPEKTNAQQPEPTQAKLQQTAFEKVNPKQVEAYQTRKGTLTSPVLQAVDEHQAQAATRPMGEHAAPTITRASASHVDTRRAKAVRKVTKDTLFDDFHAILQLWNSGMHYQAINLLDVVRDRMVDE